MKINDIYNLPEKDAATLQLLATGFSSGLFQLENQSLCSPILRSVKPETIEEIGDIASIIRPGTLNTVMHDGISATHHYIKRKNKLEDVVYDPPELEPFLKSTQGIFIYQEQSLKVSQELAKFTPAESMWLQKSISKKKADQMILIKPLFIEGCKKNGLSESDAENIFQQIEKSNRYAFNKCLSDKTTVQVIHEPHQTQYKIIKIDDVNIGDYVLGPEDKYFKVKDKIDCGLVECVKVKFTCGTKLTCSILHKFSSDHGILPLYEIIANNYKIKSDWEFADISIEKIKLVGKKHCWDLEIESEEHLFAANGIYVSNSHAVSYSYLSYACAYLKANHMKEFMVGTLRFAKEKIHPYEEIAKIVKECTYFGLEVKAPSLIHSNIDFEFKNDAIYFGFSNIKGVGESQAQNLIALRNNLSNINNWYEILMKIKGFNKTVVENGIMAGILSHIKIPRRKMLDDYKTIRMLTPKEMEWADSNWTNSSSLPELIDKLIKYKYPEGLPGVERKLDARYEKLVSILKMLESPAESLKDNVEDITAAERNLLGANVSFNNIDKIDRLGSTTIEEFKGGKVLREHSIVAEIKNIKNHTVKKTGKTMCFVQLLDQTSEMDAVVFPNTYDEYGGFLSVGRCLTFYGVRSDKGGFIVNSIKTIKK